VTPLRRLAGWNWLVRLRRMFGLYVFFYAVIHVVTYFWLDHLFDLEAIWRDIVKRPLITVGFLSFVLMIPLAATSTDRMARLLGGRRWQQLHRAVYLVAVAGVVHFWWLVKIDYTRPLVYSLILGTLLVARIAYRTGHRGPPVQVAQTAEDARTTGLAGHDVRSRAMPAGRKSA